MDMAEVKAIAGVQIKGNSLNPEVYVMEYDVEYLDSATQRWINTMSVMFGMKRKGNRNTSSKTFMPTTTTIHRSKHGTYVLFQPNGTATT